MFTVTASIVTNVLSQVCVEGGGHLAIADSSDEADVLLAMIKANNAGANAVHIGIHDRFQDGDYVTVRGKPQPS